MAQQIRMGFSLNKFLRSFDDFEHPISLTFRGEDTHQSGFGGVLTLVVTAFTISMVVTKLEQVFTMSDPTITTFAKPLT